MDGSESAGRGRRGANLVIVAIPAQDDYVWKISSEKVPHMTLLFLGELGTDAPVDRIAQFLQHSANTSLHRFGMDVERRGELGPDRADVLFFRKDYIAKDVAAFRSYLLENDDISKLYNSTEQYPEWTPHLTLGYPETPAHPDNRDYPGINWINFDRVALWTGEYEGPEFVLKDQYAMEVSMSDVSRGAEAVDDILSHYGVKGMHWGVRRAQNAQKIANRLQERADKVAAKGQRNEGKLGNASTLRTAKKIQKSADRQQKYANKLQAKVDAKTAAKLNKTSTKAEDKARKEATKRAHEEWKKNAGGTEMANKVFQKAAKDFEKTAEIINNDPNYKGKDVHSGLLGRQYQATMNHYFNEHLAQASVDLTLNDEGHAYIYQMEPGGYMRGREYKMAHAAMKPGFKLPDYRIEFDELGHAVKFYLDTELKHYGVKGMHWGVRRTDAEIARDNSARTKLGLRPRSKPTPSEDKASSNASAAKIKRGNTDALSNRELQQLVNRMNLEQQYSRLSSQSGRVKRGQQGAKDILAVGKTVNEAAQFANSPAGKGLGRVLKRAALGAAAVAGRMAAKKVRKG